MLGRWRIGRAHRHSSSRLLVAAVLVLAAAAAGCIPSGPTYPFDIFPEMHYSPSVRRQEPPRLDPPAESVPITGRPSRVDFAQARQLQSPVPKTPENLQRAAELYLINCRACHGSAGHGDGFVAQYFQQAGMAPPFDFADPYVRNLSEGQLYAIIESGQGGMPAWRNLLSAEERWALVQFVRSAGESQ